METYYQTSSPSPILFLLGSLLLFLIINYKLRRPADGAAAAKQGKAASPSLPPGPWKLPLIGNLHQVIISGSLPHHFFRDAAAKFGDIFHLRLGQVSAVIVTSPAAAAQVFKVHEPSLLTRPFCLAVDVLTPTGLFATNYGAYWRQMRRICAAELLSPRRVQSLSWAREQTAWEMVDSISSSAKKTNPVNLSEMIFAVTNNTTSLAAFGRKCGDSEEFVRLLKRAVVLSGGFELPDLFPTLKFLRWKGLSWARAELERIKLKFDMILGEIIEEHKIKKSKNFTKEEDLVDVLLKIQEDGNLDVQITTRDIKSIILDMLGAGSDTSSTTLEWAMSELLKNPEAMTKAQSEVREALRSKPTGHRVNESDIKGLTYLTLVVKETLRLHPPAPLVPKEATEDFVINNDEKGEFFIPKGAKTVVNVWAIGRDARYWLEPERFLPERFLDGCVNYTGGNFEYIPFGGGRRMCPAIPFAVANIEVPLAMLLYHFDWKLGDGRNPEEVDMIESFGASVRRKNDLILLPIIHES
ncbi:unnamed protein product [Linum tenue]|uniref:Cytochrome P450 n=1 Tax=Linum tenue TaxID=586396 RepID=A0AAV0GSD7_9ROSI|nr:unnamed protein product [Linum tenue]